jgi:N-hydroxyarylamine O-acetyltransferase
MVSAGAYLERIGYSDTTEPTAGTLRALQRAHLFAVPFENLDIGLKRVIPCDEQAAVRKIVERRRGGFCYEMNGAFAWLLRQLGYRVTLLSARVARADGSVGPEYDHLTLRVDLEEPWLADVGFGDSFLDPLRLVPGIQQKQENERFRIIEDDSRLCVEKSSADGSWKLEYAFTLEPRDLSEFASMCHYHQTSPESHFTRQRVCTLARPDGRITLTDMKLILTRAGEREERVLASDEEWRDTLRAQFGVVL